jgi:hypothetical protein
VSRWLQDRITSRARLLEPAFKLVAFSGRGVIPHRRYLRAIAGARERPTHALAGVGVSRSGAMPEPTVTVRMKESACEGVHRHCAH